MVLSGFDSTTTELYVEDFAGRVPCGLLNHVQELLVANALQFNRAAVNNLTAQLSKRWTDFFIDTKFYSALLNSSFDAVLIKNFLPPDVSKLVCQAVLLAFVRRIGILSPHTAKEDSLIWTMQPAREENSEKRFKTFSEHSAEAALHTDSQYRSQPENFLAFYVFRQARCGGGRTRLLNGQRLLNSLLASNEGRQCLKTLTVAKIPFSIPPVFITNPQKRFVKAPIFGKSPLIRYRSDTLETQLIRAFSAKKCEIDRSLDFLKFEIENSFHIKEFSLGDNDLLLINNHKNLHGRTAFQDKDRCLFRIRFN